VSTFRLEPEHFILTTGTFNLIVKDRIAFRLSGALSVRTEPLAGSRTSSKPFNRILPHNRCQPFGITGFPPVFHNGSVLFGRASGREKLKRGEVLCDSNATLFRFVVFYDGAQRFRRMPKRKTVNSEKIAWRSAFRETLQEPLFPNADPGTRDQL
jgi:hypothetical protein